MTDQAHHRDDGHGPDRDPTPPAPVGGDAGERYDVDGVPFGLPVLAEVPELAAVLTSLREVDRLLACALDGLLRLQDTGLAETATGVPLERWLAAVARRTGADRRMLATAAGVCRRLPTLHAAFVGGRVSWAQVRAITLAVHRLPAHLDEHVDGELGRVLAATGDDAVGQADVEPDDLVRAVSWALAALEAEAHEPSASGREPAEDWLAMQPRLDGSGGQLHGDFGAQGFAILDAALNEGLPMPDGPVKDAPGADPDPDRARLRGRQAARHRAARLLALCATGSGPDGDPGGGFGGAGQGRVDTEDDGPGGGIGGAGLPGLLLRAELSTLLGDDRLPAELLTRLTGGVLHVDAATARRLMETYGARLRLVLVDHGEVVGVGRSSRRPPGWLTDAALALRDACSEPGCRTPARVCDVDHARPWTRDGRTDVDNLAPVCASANHRKETAGWRVHQAPDGVRIWTHPRTGLSTRTLPARWRPPPPTDPPTTTHSPTTTDPPPSDGTRPPPTCDPRHRGPPGTPGARPA